MRGGGPWGKLAGTLGGEDLGAREDLSLRTHIEIEMRRLFTQSGTTAIS